MNSSQGSDLIPPIGSNLSIYEHDYSKNVCIRIQDHIFDFVDLAPVQAGFGFAYSVLFILGLCANCATLRCLITFRPARSGALSHNPAGPNGKRGLKFGVSREFLISLTLADLILICCTSLPLTAVHIFTRRWLLGQYVCKFGPLLQGVGCFVTSFSLTAIAVERYCMVATGRSKAGPKVNVCVVIAIWLVALAASIPLAFAHVLRRECVAGVGCFCGEFCDEIGWRSDWDRTRYGIAASALQYVLPACVLAFCYYKVRQRVKRGVQKRLQREHVSLINQQRLSQRKNRTSCMTLLLFAGFACPWLPMCAMNLLRDFNHLPEDWYAVAFAGGHLIAMTSVLCNPIVYCWANRMFRSAFTNALFCGWASRCLADDYQDDCEERYCGDTAAGRTLSTFEPSTRRRSDNSYQSLRSCRLSSHSSGRRSRLATVGSLGLANGKPRPCGLHAEGEKPNMLSPTVILRPVIVKVAANSDAVAV